MTSARIAWSISTLLGFAGSVASFFVIDRFAPNPRLHREGGAQYLFRITPDAQSSIGLQFPDVTRSRFEDHGHR